MSKLNKIKNACSLISNVPVSGTVGNLVIQKNGYIRTKSNKNRVLKHAKTNFRNGSKSNQDYFS